MKLLTHNSLRNIIEGAETELPLLLKIDDMEVGESEFNPEFIIGLLPSLDWTAVKLEADAIGFDGIPEMFDDSLLKDEDFLRAMQHLLLDVEVITGTLTCQTNGRVIPVIDGVVCFEKL